MKRFFLTMLSGSDQISSFRFVFVLTGTLFPIAFVAVWTYSSLLAKPPIPMDIPEGVRWLLGVLLTSKSINLAVEAYKQKIVGNGNGHTNGKETPDAEVKP